jgi:hypothetical protein
MATITDLNNAFGRVQAGLGRPMFDQPESIQTAWSNLVFRANADGNANWGGLPASGTYGGAVPALNSAADGMRDANYSSATSVRGAITRTRNALTKLEKALGL